MSGSDALYRFDADFKKVPGSLTLTSTHVAWVAKNPAEMDRQNQAMNRVVNMLASKAGSAKVSLKLVFKDDIPAGGLFFTFTNPETREDDRKVVQDTLIPFVSANRAGPSNTTAATATGAFPSAPGSGSGSTPGTPSAMIGSKRKAVDGGSPLPGGGGGGKSNRPEDWNLRKKVLMKNPTLNLLYKELVLDKQITDAEFWEGREGLINAERLAQAQRPGRPSRLLDDRFDLDTNRKNASTVGGTGVGVKAKTDTGPMIIKLNKELTREIFEEFPVVQDAYARYVPGISEAEFWSRYFQSQLWERHRASVRQSSSEDLTRRRDDIFDQYLEEPDWNVEPRNQQDEDVNRFLDLAATEEDHGETSTQRDVTMQAGREKTSLPLIRRFNDHSNKLLRHGKDQQTNGGYLSTILPDDTDIYDEIDLEDLRGPAVPSTITLDVHEDAVDDTSGKDGEVRGILPGKSPEELLAIASDQAAKFSTFHQDFVSVSLPTPPGGWEKNRQESTDSAEQAKAYQRYSAQKLGADAAGHVLRDMHLASNAESAPMVPLPENLFDQMRSCHNAATEFLRQYWSAILPTSSAKPGPSTIAAKNAKAEKMAGYLKLTEGKVNAVIHTATLVGVDPLRIKAALAPTMGAVNVALNREKKRISETNGST